MLKELINLILCSKMFPIANKWAIVSYIKSNNISNTELNEITALFEIEKIVINKGQSGNKEEYLKALNLWNKQINKLTHKWKIAKLHKNEEYLSQIEKAEAENMLEQINKL